MDYSRTVLAGLLLLSASTARAALDYRVAVYDEDPATLHVAGSFTLESDTLRMEVTFSPQLEGGQADLVRDLVVRDGNGERLDVEYQGGGEWRVDGGAEGQLVEVEYDILLEHGKYDWGPGIDEVAYKRDDGVFFTGFSLFVVPGIASTDKATVRFDLPPGWRASTPWRATDPDGRTFEVAGATELLWNCLFLGTHLEETVALEGFTFVLALGGELAAKKELFVEAMAPLLPAYVETFGGMPAASRYLVVINPGSRSDGGAFPSSYSMLLAGEVSRATAPVWGHGIAHELAHFWNGQTMVPASESDEEWFKEGVTDYLTIVQLARTGLDPWEVTTRKLENMARRYVLAKRLLGIDESMRAAGADKHRKRFLVYGGGALAAFALDVRIREATGNRAGLDELMRAMYREFGGTGKRYTFEDVERLASEIAGSSQQEFLDRYVDGTEILDVVPLFASIGLRMTTVMDEFYLSRRDDATPAQRAMVEAIFSP